MLSIERDTVGRHDFLYTPCSQDTFALIYKLDPHPSCFGNLCSGLAPFGIAPDRIPTTFNIFMNVELTAEGARGFCRHDREPATSSTCARGWIWSSA